jgi:hypothetical protein
MSVFVAEPKQHLTDLVQQWLEAVAQEGAWRVFEAVERKVRTAIATDDISAVEALLHEEPLLQGFNVAADLLELRLSDPDGSGSAPTDGSARRSTAVVRATVMHLAAEQGRLKLLDALASAGADLNASAGSGEGQYLWRPAKKE